MTYEDEVLADSPRLWWRFSESAGNYTDASGNGNPDTDTSGVLYQQPPLLMFDLYSVGFTGDNAAYVFYSMNTSPWMDYFDNPDFSIEASIRPDEAGLTGERTIVGRWYTDPSEDTSRQRWRLYTVDGVLKFAMRGTFGLYDGMNNVTGIDGPMLVADEDRHVIVTYTAGTMTMYVDGVQVGQSLQDPWYYINHVLIGIDGNLASRSWSGLIDEVSYYTTALPLERVQAHYELASSVPPPGGHVGLADETEEALPIGLHIVGAPVTIPVGLVTEHDTAPVLVGQEQPVVKVFVGKAIESEEALSFEPLVQVPAAISRAQEEEIPLPFTSRFQTGVGVEVGGQLVVKLGMAVEHEQARQMGLVGAPPADTVVVGTVQMAVWTGPAGSISTSSTLFLDILERELLQAPTSVLVSVGGAIPNRMLTFSIDGVDVHHEMMPDGSGTALFSVPVPEAQGRRGEHVLAVDQNGAASASAIFTLVYDPDLLPTERGPDTRPVDIPESHHPSGVLRWVLQDLMPGGLGSYVMPLNPQEMDNPEFERTLTQRHSTANAEGQPHVSEGSVRPLEWSFKGYCPTEEMAEKLRAYADLRRRFYVIDHRGRAWVFVSTSAEIVPRLQQRNIYDELTDWVHDYTISGVIFQRAEFA